MALDKKNSVRKRKANASVNDEDDKDWEKKQKVFNHHISEIDFKNQLKNDVTAIDGLEEFVKVAEAHGDGEDCTDIVSAYCSSSTECKELFDILERRNPSTKLITSVYECLTKILLYVQGDDDSKLWPTADFIVQKMVTSSRLEQMYYCLSTKNKSHKIKSTLQLLIAMVMLNKKAKRAVQAKFKFDNNHLFRELFDRRDRQDPGDVRSCIVLFTMSFIIDGDNTFINTMLQQKSFIQMTLSGLVYDPKEMVMDVLSILLDKVVMNEAVLRPAKLQLFTVNILMELSQLYEWEGPRGWKNSEKSFLTDVDFVAERASVAGQVHEFLLAICSPKKYSLTFLDRSVGAETRNYNPLMTRFLQSLVKRPDNPFVRKLIAKILDTCPDLFSHFVPGWAHSLVPSATIKRADSIDLLIEIYKSQTPIPVFLPRQGLMPEDVDGVVRKMTTYYLPCDYVWVCITQGIKHESLSASHQCLNLMKIILQNVTAILTAIGPIRMALATKFSRHAVKALPDPTALFLCIQNILKILSDPAKIEAVGTDVDLVEYVSAVLKTLHLYQRLSPSLLSDRPSDVARLVETVGRLQVIIDAAMEDDGAGDTGSGVILPQLDLLELLSETGVEILPLVQGGLLENLLTSAHSLKENHKKGTISLVYKILTSTGVLSGHKDELCLWIGAALSPEGKDSSHPIKFLSDILCRVISNPMPYLDKVMAVLLETTVLLESQRSPVKGLKKKGGRKDPAIQDVLKMDDDDLDLSLSTVHTTRSGPEHRTNTSLPFSPVTSAAIETLQAYEGDETAMEYVTSVTVDILHSQADPTAYIRLVSGHWQDDDNRPGVKQYFDYWAGKTKSQPLEMTLPTPYNHLLEWFIGDDLDLADTEELEDLPEEKRLSCLKQAMFYLAHCFSESFTLGKKWKRVQILRKVVTDIFTSLVNGVEISGDDDMEVDDKENETETMPRSHDSRQKGTENISAAFLCIANSPVMKENFLISLEDESRSDDRLKICQSVMGLLCEVLSTCGHLRLSPSCKDIFDIYLGKAMDRLDVTGKDHGDYLTIINALSSRVNLPSIIKCISCFLKLPPSSFIEGIVTDDQVSKVHKGKMLHNITPLGETFYSLLKALVHLLSLYNVTNFKDTSITLTLSAQPKQSDSNLENRPLSQETQNSSENQNLHQLLNKFHSDHVTTTQLSTSDFSSIFDVLLMSSKFDSPILSIVRCLPHIGACCSQNVAKSLINNLSSLGQDRKLLVEALMSSHASSFHQICGQYIGKHAKTILKKGGHFGLVKVYLQHDEADPDVVQSICQRLLSSCQDFLPSLNNDSLLECLHTLIDKQDVPDDFHQDLFVAVATFIPANRSSTRFEHFSLLDAICKHLHTIGKGSSTHQKTESDFLELLLKFITHLSKRKDRDLSMENRVISLAKTSASRGDGSLSKDFMENDWPGLVKSVLKHMYNQHAALDLIAVLMGQVFKNKDKSVSTPECGGVNPAMTFQMCISHTAFMPTLMADTDIQAKDSLVHLLHTCFTLETSCVSIKLLTPLMGAYSASLSLTDQRLLALINACLKSDKTTNSQLPVLWGKAYLDHKATSKSFGRGDQQPNVSMDMVLGEIDDQKMEDTILNFAMKRSAHDFTVCDASELMSKSESYDLNYLLRIFLQILSPKKIVQVRAFAEKNCIGFLLTCLSSKFHHTRLMAYKCLNDFYAHLESSPCPARHEFAYILDVLNASRTKESQRLPYVMTLYLGRAIKLVLDPSDHMYLRIMKFICHKPQIDLNNVPEFYKFFFSSETNYLKERTWMLTLLRDGIRDADDYQMYRVGFVFKHLMAFYTSSISDKRSKFMVLELIRNTCGQTRAVKDLVKDHGLMPWLSAVVSGLDKKPGMVEVVADILNAVCGSLGVKGQIEVMGGGVSSVLEGEKSEGVREGFDDDELMHRKLVSGDGLEVSQSTKAALLMLVKSFNSLVALRRVAGGNMSTET